MAVKKRGSTSNVGLITTLIFFVLATVGLGVTTYLGFADQTEKEKAKTDENRRFSDKGGAPLGLTSDDGTIKVLGASMRPAHLTKESAEAVSQQTETLPGNMAAHDQLTSIRSAIESMTGFMPTDAGRRIDFTTDDRTMLATHISARFPNLADVLGMRHPGRAEGWTPNTESERREPSYLTRLIECIVKSRRMGVGKDKALAVSPTVKEFQEYWTTQLSELASKQPTEMVTRVEELMQEFKVG